MKHCTLIPLVFAIACDLESASKSGSGFDSGMATDDTSFDSGLDEDNADGDEPVWWALQAELVLEKGLATGGIVTIAPISGESVQLCPDTEPITITTITEQPIPYEGLLTWWRLELELIDELCPGVSNPLSGPLYLGVGEMDPNISAALSAVEGLSTSMPLNGAYATLPNSAELFVFGVAGPEAAYAKQGKPAEKAPLEDGLWRIEPVYWFGY